MKKIANEEAKSKAVEVEAKAETVDAEPKKESQKVVKEAGNVQPFAIDYSIEGETFRTIVNATSAEIALQEFTKLAGLANPILALKLSKEEEKVNMKPLLIKLSAYNRINIEQIGVAKINVPEKK